MQPKYRSEIAIIGLGGWGEKLVRIATELRIPLHGFDLNERQRIRIKQLYPSLTIHSSLEHILTAKNITGVVIATPPSSHYVIAQAALKATKHILIEKPMTQDVDQAKSLRLLAKKRHCVLMIDHTYVFSPALTTAKKLLAKHTVGKIQRIESVRSGSRILTDSTVLWDFASHDAAIALHSMERMPLFVRTLAVDYRKNHILEDATIELTFPDDVRYIGHVSWTDPIKERTLTIVGQTGALTMNWSGKHELLTKHMHHTNTVITTPAVEPLHEMLTHFMHCIQTNSHPYSDGDMGVKVVEIIAALHHSWKKRGARVRVT